MGKKRISTHRLPKKITMHPMFYIAIAIIAILAYIFNVAGGKWNIFSDGGVAEGNIEVHFIDVGQGDAALILTEHGSVLIDAGPTDSGDKVASYISNRTDSLEYMILSHPHEDHIGGAGAVFNKVTVKNVIMPDKTADTSSFDRVLNGIEKSGANVISAEKGKGFQVGDLRMEFLSPEGDKNYEETNNVSAVVRVSFGDTSFLFTGDAETLVEEELLESGQRLKSDVLKVGHHGSSTSSCEKFIKAVDPQLAVISCGKDNSYGHPHTEVRKLLENCGIDYYRTDRVGTVVITSDGSKVSVGE